MLSFSLKPLRRPGSAVASTSESRLVASPSPCGAVAGEGRGMAAEGPTSPAPPKTPPPRHLITDQIGKAAEHAATVAQTLRFARAHRLPPTFVTCLRTLPDEAVKMLLAEAATIPAEASSDVLGIIRKFAVKHQLPVPVLEGYAPAVEKVNAAESGAAGGLMLRGLATASVDRQSVSTTDSGRSASLRPVAHEGKGAVSAFQPQDQRYPGIIEELWLKLAAKRQAHWAHTKSSIAQYVKENGLCEEAAEIIGMLPEAKAQGLMNSKSPLGCPRLKIHQILFALKNIDPDAFDLANGFLPAQFRLNAASEPAESIESKSKFVKSGDTAVVGAPWMAMVGMPPYAWMGTMAACSWPAFPRYSAQTVKKAKKKDKRKKDSDSGRSRSSSSEPCKRRRKTRASRKGKVEVTDACSSFTDGGLLEQQKAKLASLMSALSPPERKRKSQAMSPLRPLPSPQLIRKSISLFPRRGFSSQSTGSTSSLQPHITRQSPPHELAESKSGLLGGDLSDVCHHVASSGLVAGKIRKNSSSPANPLPSFEGGQDGNTEGGEGEGKHQRSCKLKGSGDGAEAADALGRTESTIPLPGIYIDSGEEGHRPEDLPSEPGSMEQMLQEWLKKQDGGKGVLLQFFDTLKREFDSDFAQIAAARLIDPVGPGAVGLIDPSFWEACGVKLMGHKMLLANAIIALPY